MFVKEKCIKIFGGKKSYEHEIKGERERRARKREKKKERKR